MTKTDEALRLAKEALLNHEWESQAVYYVCPWCGNEAIHGHKKNCLRQRALAAIDEALGTPPSHTPKASELEGVVRE